MLKSFAFCLYVRAGLSIAFAFLLLFLARRLRAIRGDGFVLVSLSEHQKLSPLPWIRRYSCANIVVDDDDCSEEDTTKEMISLSMERIEQQGDLIQFGIWTPVTH
jgi:hypothetical protein